MYCKHPFPVFYSLALFWNTQLAAVQVFRSLSLCDSSNSEPQNLFLLCPPLHLHNSNFTHEETSRRRPSHPRAAWDWQQSSPFLGLCPPHGMPLFPLGPGLGKRKRCEVAVPQSFPIGYLQDSKYLVLQVTNGLGKEVVQILLIMTTQALILASIF